MLPIQHEPAERQHQGCQEVQECLFQVVASAEEHDKLMEEGDTGEPTAGAPVAVMTFKTVDAEQCKQMCHCQGIAIIPVVVGGIAVFEGRLLLTGIPGYPQGLLFQPTDK